MVWGNIGSVNHLRERVAKQKSIETRRLEWGPLIIHVALSTAKHKRRQEKNGPWSFSSSIFYTYPSKEERQILDWWQIFSSSYNFVAKWQEIQSNQLSSTDFETQVSTPSMTDMELWTQQYETKKGHVYGLGSERTKYKRKGKGTCSSQSF